MSTFLPLNSGTIYRVNQHPDRNTPVRRHEVQALARQLRKEGTDAVVIGQPKVLEESKFLPLLPLLPRTSTGLGLVTGNLAKERKALEDMRQDTHKWDQEVLKHATLDLYV